MLRYPSGPYGREIPDDYDEELRAYSRKREREKRNEVSGRKHGSASKSDNSSGDDGQGSSREEEEEKETPRSQRKKSKKSKDGGQKSSRSSEKKPVTVEGTIMCWVCVMAVGMHKF